MFSIILACRLVFHCSGEMSFESLGVFGCKSFLKELFSQKTTSINLLEITVCKYDINIQQFEKITLYDISLCSDI